MLAVVLSAAHAAAEGPTDYQVKASFLYNLAKFVEWPDDAFGGPTSPIALCILGQNPFDHILEQAVKGKIAQRRSFAVRTLDSPAQAGTCQIVFISSSQRKGLPSILGSFQAKAVLTVGDSEGFAAAGGMVNFIREGGTIRMEINLEAAARERLKISSRLLGLARIVTASGQ